jgi:anti-anti-sigma regulatory factor
VLRTLHAQDAFEMVALDYCVTYEDVPPPWQDAKCTLETGSAQQAGAASADDANVALRGQVTGDSTQALAALDGQTRGQGENIVVNCQALLRVDFAAAGSLLNWVAARQGEGCKVQFRDVHRLVAAFFNVIGINEHAQVVPRAM